MALNDLRQEQILEILEENREVQVTRLATQLQVSEMTIRRDLKLLEQRGRLKRVYGGAVATSNQAFAPVADRASVNSDEKERIAATAEGLVTKDMRVFVNGGSTTLALARRLARGTAAQFTTNSIEAAQVVAAGGVSDVTLLGGTLRRDAGTLIGPEALEMLERRSFDLAIVGITAIHPSYGFLDPTEWHAYSSRVLRQRSRQVVILADHTKFEADSDIRSFDARDVDILVTDRRPPESHAALLTEGGIEVLWPGKKGDER
ncbi:MAG: DeoR/GlpR family DNA-binding transcription regulator [Kiloniellales bacterium]|nr:DeoR/GlpR family DNA-binding transcription regulator [Kiloniellales bacterium]